MDHHLLVALIESLTDAIADKVVQRLSLRPPVKAQPRQLDVPLAAVPAPAVVAPADPDELLSTEEAAVLLKVSPKGLEGMRAKGTGPKYVRVGRLIRYRRGDLV